MSSFEKLWYDYLPEYIPDRIGLRCDPRKPHRFLYWNIEKKNEKKRDIR